MQYTAYTSDRNTVLSLRLPMQSLIHRHRGTLFFLLSAFLFIGIGLLVYYAQAEGVFASNSSAFSRQFSQFIVPDITIGSTTYSVSHGVVATGGKVVTNPNTVSKVFRIAYFTIANRLDPIMALGGTDPAKLTLAIAALRQSVDSLSAAYPSSIRTVLANSFYPIAFLETLPQLEKNRIALLTHPSYSGALLYNTSLQTALTHYQSALNETASALDGLGSKSIANNEYTFPNGYTTSGVFGARLSALAASAEDDQQKALARFSCLQGNNTACTPLQSLLPRTSSLSGVSTTLAALPPPVTHVESVLTSMEKTNATVLGEQFMGLGVVALTKSDCVPTTGPFYMYLWTIRDAHSPVPDFQFESINNMYFYDLRKKTSSAFYTDLQAHGLSFLGQRVSNFYECPDSGIESARVASLYRLADSIAQRPLFLGKAFQKRSPLIKRAATEESEITNAPFISEDAISQYVGTISNLLSATGEESLARQTSPDTVYALERRIALYHDQSALFDQQIQTAIAMNSIIAGINAMMQKQSLPFNPFWLYLSRSYPALFYLAGNESVVRGHLSFFLQKAPVPLSSFQLVTLSDLDQSYSESQIQNFLDLSSEEYRKLGVRGL